MCTLQRNLPSKTMHQPPRIISDMLTFLREYLSLLSTSQSAHLSWRKQESSVSVETLQPSSSSSLSWTNSCMLSSASQVSRHLPRENKTPLSTLALKRNSDSTSAFVHKERIYPQPQSFPNAAIKHDSTTLPSLLASKVFLASSICSTTSLSSSAPALLPPSPFLSSTTSRISSKSLAMLLILAVLALPADATGDHEFAYFNSTTHITFPNYTWTHETTMQVTFKTCFSSGTLFSLIGEPTLTSSLSSSSANTSSESLSLSIVNASVCLSWSMSGQSQVVVVPVRQAVSDGRWYRVRLRYQLEAVSLEVYSDNNIKLGEETVASGSYNSFLLDKTLSGPLTVGQGFDGCMYQGPGVSFNSPDLVTRGVVWNTCPPLQGCATGDNNFDNCYKNPCVNGKCEDGPNSYKCICPPNFNGTHCEFDLASMYGCAIDPCQNQGTCQDLPQNDQGGRRFKCTCPDGYTGVICETMIDLCRTQPCAHGSTCTSGLNSYTCNCTGTGYEGTNCTEDINECRAATNPCINAQCFNQPGGFTCDCPPGFDGSPCVQINECLTQPCKNGANCTDEVNRFICHCLEGYTGQTCDVNIDDCVTDTCPYPNSLCRDGVNSYTCECVKGFAGDPASTGCRDVDECDPRPFGQCRNGANCTNQIGGYNCSCLPGFTGQDCEINIDECDPNPCRHNASCRDGNNTYTCECLPGYTGVRCEQDINECEENDCRNGANCTDMVNGYKCECVPGWTGDLCESDIDECNPNPCLIGDCENKLNEFYCACPTGYTGLTCEININDCDPNPCQNNGRCLDGVDKYQCVCGLDWMGVNCTEVYDACTDLRPCKNGGNCTSEPRVHSFDCACPTGFNGSACEINIDDCAIAGPNACQPYQVCRDGIDTYTCSCPIGFGGVECKVEINECDAKPCKNDGNCTDGRGNYTCSCKQTIIDISSVIGPKGVFISGYTGQNCEEDINECEVYTDPPICQSDGLCKNLAGAFSCYCPAVPGDDFFVGTLCESRRSYCDIRLSDQQCENGATCVNTLSGSKCVCAPGYSDPFCRTDINECLPQPCEHNSTCHDRINSFECTCQPGWTGQRCEVDIDDCLGDPCKNKGVCQDGLNSFTCNCTDTGFEGDICEININDCVNDPCRNGGTCEDGIKGYKCKCLPAYTGPNCETDIPDCAPSPCLFGSTCKERSNVTLYGKGDPEFVTFTFAGAAGYVCECANGVKGVNCSEDINECEDPANTPCRNGANCLNSFQTFSCDCVPGYTDRLCETEINECGLLQPCKNGGTCTDLINDYNCSCPAATIKGPSYAGKNCTTYLSGCDSPPRICGPGDCVPKLLSENPINHGYNCICPAGYRGTNCATTTDFSFLHSRADGLIRNDKLMTNANGVVRLSLSFSTTLSDALLVLGQVNQQNDAFISVELQDGRVLVRYKIFETGIITSAIIPTTSKVNDGQYHKLEFTVAQGIHVSMPAEMCTASNTSTSAESCQFSDNFRNLFEPQVSFLFIANEREFSHIDTIVFPQRYVGCMRDVTLNGDWIYPGNKAGALFNVTVGCSRREQCLPGVCNNRGRCEDLWDKFQCECNRPFTGDTCSDEYPAATFNLSSWVSQGFSTRLAEIDTVDFSFFLTTKQRQGFLVYFSSSFYVSYPDSISFMGLYLKNGKLAGDLYNCGALLSFDTSTSVTASSLDDGLPHLVMIDIKPMQFLLIVDDVVVFENYTIPNSEGHCEPNMELLVRNLELGRPPADQTLSGRKKRDVARLGRSKRQTTIQQTVMSSFQIQPPFEGVFQDVRLNKETIDFKDDNVLPGKQSTQDMCTKLDPCDQAVNCSVIYYNDYKCICKFGYRGKNCSEPDFCSYATCPVESSCVNLRNGYECVGVGTFFQASSLLSYTMTEDLVKLSSGSDLDLRFTMRTRGKYGLIFQMRQGPYHLSLRVTKGHLEVNYKLKAGEFEFSTNVANTRKVNDGKWYHVRFQIMNSTHFELQVFSSPEQTPMVHTSSTAIGTSQPQLDLLETTGPVEFLPMDPEVDLSAMLSSAGNVSELLLGGPNAVRSSRRWEAAFNGCLWGVRIGGVLLPFYTDSTFSNNSNTERFLVTKKVDIAHDCSGQNQCSAGGPGYRFCGNGGHCVDEWNAFRCDCQTGFEGTQCQTNPDNCVSNDCVNQATCLDGFGDFTCVCMPGFTGDRCEVPIDQCDENQCQNGGSCVDRGYDYTCNCSVALGFTGWYCNVTLNQTCDSNSSLCQNGASCTDNGSSFECTGCPTLYEGPLCERQKNVCGSNNNSLCHNGGKCSLDSSKQTGYKCECDPDRDFTGPNCTSEINDCLNIDCKNGVCVDGNRNYTCDCNQGYNGHHCDQQIDACTAGAPNCRHGNCSNGVCACDNFYEGDGCEDDKDECALSDPICKNDGVCTNKEGGFDCYCTLGYRGDTCNEPFCDRLCESGSTCVIDTVASKWRCECPQFIEGQLCDIKGPCYFGPCEQGQTMQCLQSIANSTYDCICQKGWQGENCTDDVNECTTQNSAEKHQCEANQGTCVNNAGSYTCNCIPGYTGQYCRTEINECDVGPCFHGKCIDKVNNFTCDCSGTGYEGLTCESDIDECKQNPPVCNHGNCSNSAPGFTCLCGDRWLGQFCNRENPCYNISCQHGGTCQENVTAVEERCACTAGYEGVVCEKALGSSSSDGTDIGVIIGPIVGGLVLIIIIIVVIAFLISARSKRATRGAYSPSAQENAGSRVEQGGVLKKPPEERLI